MALRNILQDDDPGLQKKSRCVTDFNKRLHILLDDMRETLLNANGLGLAAPQVGVLRKAAIIVKSPDEPKGNDTSGDPPVGDATDPVVANPTTDPEPEPEIIELINPEIVHEQGKREGSEGCLSMPGVFCLVKRPQTVIVRAQDRYGKTFEIEATDMTARAACHEIDHLDGVLFTSIAVRRLTEEEVEEMRKNNN